LRENETTLDENRPITSALNHINENKFSLFTGAVRELRIPAKPGRRGVDALGRGGRRKRRRQRKNQQEEACEPGPDVHVHLFWPLSETGIPISRG